jgi:hypothetical protein
MAQQREATTNRLVGIITDIKLERKSGQLRVRRGEGLTSEEGILTFAQGQVTQARVGRRSGADALNWLSVWGQARYTFISSTSVEELTPTFPALPSSSPGRKVTNPEMPAIRPTTDRLELTHSTRNIPGEEVPHACMNLGEATARIERAGLPRIHRRLYLLIDGHRSVYELAPLIGKRVEEMRSMLHDLEWLGIIQITASPSET